MKPTHNTFMYSLRIICFYQRKFQPLWLKDRVDSLVGIFLISVGMRQSTDGFLSATKTTQISPNKRYIVIAYRIFLAIFI
jgi:hypothetical protein